MVNDSHAAALTKLGKHFFRFIRTNIVVCQNAFNIFNALAHNLVIICAAILSKQKLKDISRNISPFLDLLCEIFPDNLPVEIVAEFALDDFTGIHRTLDVLIHDVPP